MASLMLDSSGSDDEFPAVASIIRRHRSSKPTASSSTTTTTTTTKVPTLLGQDDKENLPSPSSKPQLKLSSMSPQKVQATPMRRRKLGLAQTQAVDGSLFQPWTGKKGGADAAEDVGSRAVGRTATKQRERESSRLNTKSSRALLRTRGSIESFNSSCMMDTTANTTTTSKDLRRMRSRPRLEIDSDEDDEDPFVRRRGPKSVRPLRFRELLAARSAAPHDNNNDDDDDDDNDDEESPNPTSQLQREAARRRMDYSSKADTTAGSSSFQTNSNSEGASEFNASAFQQSDLDSELFCKTPPKTVAKTPGRRRLNVAKTAASVNPVEKKAAPRTASRATSVARKDDPTKKDKLVPANGNGAASISKGPLATKGAGLEDAFEKLKIFNDFSDSDSDRHPQKPAAAAMDPSTPSKKTNKPLTASSLAPKTPRIPMSPWKPEHKEFWDPEVNFAWVDKHSPEKQQPSAPKLDFTSNKHQSQASPKKRSAATPGPAAGAAGTIQPVISPTKKQQREAKKAFDATKDELARSFLAALDERVTEGRLSQLTEATGGLRTVWSNALQTTAGRAHWKCRTVSRTTTHADDDGSMAGETVKEAQHEAHIELASKVLTNEADLLNTVAHEFCHLVVFMLHHNPNDKNAKKPAAHGSEFKSWGRKVSAAFAHRGISVTTKHSYDIDYKFAWRCGDCTTEVQRHSRSVDPRRHRCGRCRGLLVQIRPVPRGGVVATTADEGSGMSGNEKGTMKKRQPSAWQEFLAREMKELSNGSSGAARSKEEGGKGLSFEKKMEIVSGKWKTVRDTQGGGGGGGAAAAKKTGNDKDSSSSNKDITEGIKALEIEDGGNATATATAAGAGADDGAVSATADGEDDDDDVVVISSSSSSG